MYNDITIVHDHPAITGKALLLSLFTMFGLDVFNDGIGKRIDHTVTGASADNEIVCK